MKKLLPLFATLCATFINAQTTSFTLTYNFAQVSSTTTPCTGTVDPTPPPTATGLTSGSFTAVGTNTCPSTSGYFSFAGWGLGATNGDDNNFTGNIDLLKYYNITITPQTNYELAIDSINFKALRSGTGPRFWAVRSNINGYASNLTASSSNTNISVTVNNEFKWTTDTYTTSTIQSGLKVTLGAPTFTQLTAPVSFRWYAWNAESTAGTFRIDDVNIYGSATLATGMTKISHNINAHFVLSPNPATSSIVYLTPQNIKEINFIEIIDALGNTIYKNNKVDVTGKIELNLDNIPAGMYFVRLGSAKDFYLEKLVIKK
ncbi:MAG: T9SS type A sorting domain-containing protein [Bacteroidia bacterium]|nr:T9SS type A sorting domain-containing protein [Bacteroidia bacterium]